MKIAVLAGGTSTEREISIVSGSKVCEALRKKGHQAILIDVFCGKEDANADTIFTDPFDLDKEVAYMSSFNDQITRIQEERKSFFGPHVLEICDAADVVFLALHGACGEDGRVQATFDLMGIPYTGSGYLGSALAMDKSITKQLFMENGVPTPKGIILHRSEERKSAAKLGFRFPCVVKTACGGSSVGVYIVNTEEEFTQALQDGFSYEEKLVIEEYVKGREFSVGVVEGKAYPVIEIAPLVGFYDYKNKYQAGSTIET